MPTMLNPRSLALMNANPRLLTSPNAGVILNPSSEFFHINNSGINNPAIITFNAMLIAMTGTVTFSVTGGTLTNVVGNTCALAYENMLGETCTVKASITYRNLVYEDTVEISKVYDGANGVTGLNNALMYAYQRSATTPVGTPGVVEWSFPAAGITTQNLQNGWKKTIPAGAEPLWITAASASSSGSLDTVQANEWTTPVILAQDGPAGAKGINSAIITIYRRTTTTTAPALPSVSATYTFSPAGLTGLNNSWTTTLPPMSNGQYLWASTATAVSVNATDDIPAGEWAAVQMLVQNGTAGTRGNAIVARAIPGTIWSDSEAVLAISSQGFGTPQNRDIVTLYNNAANYSEQKYYDGTNWQALGAYFPGSVIVDKTLDATALKANTITGDKIKAGAITASKVSISPGALNKDPNFEDFTGSWTYTGSITIGVAGGSAPAPKYAGASAGAAGIVTSVDSMPIDSTKTYTLHASIYGEPTNNRTGYLLVNFYDSSGNQILNTGWGDATTGYSGYVASFIPTVGDWRPYTNNQFGVGTTKPIPATAKTCKIIAFLNNGGSSNTLMGITAFKLLMANDSSLIVKGGITADKISVSSLSAMSAYIGVLSNRVNGTGQGMVLTNNGFTFYDNNNIDRITMQV